MNEKGKDVKREPEGLEKQQMRILLSAAKTNENHYLWFRLLYCFGLQVFELIELRVEDVDWAEYRIHIRHSKKLKSRSLEIPSCLRRDLWFACQGKQETDFLCSGRRGRLHPRTIQKMFSKLQGITGFSVSVVRLRRSLAFHLFEAGWERGMIRDQLGLSSQKSLRDLIGSPGRRLVAKIFPLEEIQGSAA